MKISPIGKAISQTLKNYTNTYTHSTAFKLAGAILATTFVIGPVQATERKWTSCSLCITNNWNETSFGSTHWSSNQLPSNGDSLLFDTTFPTVTNNNFSDLDVRNIEFKGASNDRWVTGNQIDLIVSFGSGIQNFSAGAVTFDTALSLQGHNSITVNTSGDIVLNGNITDSVLYNGPNLIPSIVKIGQGNLILGGNNSSMHGEIDVREGALVLNEGNVLSDNTTVILRSGTVLDVNGTAEDFGGLTGSGNVDLSNGGSIIVGYNNEGSTFSGELVDNAFETDGAFGKAGSGTLTLSGNNSEFAGDITVYDGTLKLSGSSDLSTSTTVIVEYGGTFDLSGTVEEFGGLSGSGDFKIGGGTATIGLNGDNTVFYGSISGENGQLIKAGSGTTYIGGNNTYTGGTIINGGTLEGNDSGIQGDIVNNANLTLNQSSGSGFYNSDISGTGTLTITGRGVALLGNTNNSYSGETRIQQGTLAFNGSSTSSENSGVNINDGQLWVLGENTIKYLSGNAIADITLGNLTIGDGNNTAFSGVIVGAGSLTKNGSGTQRLFGNNNYTGGTTINGGTLEGNASGIQGDIVNNANLTLNQSGTGFYNSDISGTGTLTKIGTGVAYLNNTNNSYSGETRIQRGTLAFNGSSTGSDNSGVNISNGAQLFVNGDNTSKYLSGNGTATINGGNLTIGNGKAQTFSGVIRDGGAGAGSLTKNGNGTQGLYGTNTYTGGTTINGGTLIGNANSLQGDIVNNANLTLNESSGSGFYNSDISGTGTLTKIGTGVAYLDNTNNSYSGESRIQQGTLAFNGSSTGSETSGVNISNGAQLLVNGNNSSKYLSGNGTAIINGGNLTIGDGNNKAFYGVIRDGGAGAGAGSLTKNGSGAQWLFGTNTYTGGTTINGGTLVGNANSLQGDIVNNANLTLNQSGNGFYDSFISGTGTLTKRSGGTAYLNNTNNSYSGETLIQQGALAFNGSGTSSEDSGVNISNDAFLLVNGDGNNTTKYLKGNGIATIYGGDLTIGDGNGQTFSGVIEGYGSLNKNGSGTQTLSGINTYTGDTKVLDGTLRISNTGSIDNAATYTQTGGHSIVDGSLKQNNVDIQAGVLSGSGMIEASSITIGEQAQVNPGNSPGSLIMMADVDFNGRLQTEIFNNSVYDTLDIRGTVTLSETSQFDFIFDDSYIAIDGDSFNFLTALDIDFGMAADFFDISDFSHFSIDGLTAGFDWSISYFDGSNLMEDSYLSLLLTDNRIGGSNPVPAPATLALFGIGVSFMSWSNRRRPKTVS